MPPRSSNARPRDPSGAFGGPAGADSAVLGPWLDRIMEGGQPIGGNAPVRAIIAPHVDPTHAARVYGSAYRLLRDHPARRIVILGVGHAGGPSPYVLIDQPIATPFGPCAIDDDFVRALGRNLPFDPLAPDSIHRGEHSILRQALFLRRALGRWDERRIVPILCCFAWETRGRHGADSAQDGWIEAFEQRLAGMLDGRTLVVAGVDLAHVDLPRLDAPLALEPLRRETEVLDRELLEFVVAGDREGFRKAMDHDEDARGICGYPAIMTLLGILPGSSGIVIDYGQTVDPSGGTLISFAAALLR